MAHPCNRAKEHSQLRANSIGKSPIVATNMDRKPAWVWTCFENNGSRDERLGVRFLCLPPKATNYKFHVLLNT